MVSYIHFSTLGFSELFRQFDFTRESHRAGHFLKSTTVSHSELQVCMAASGHQTVNLPTVGGLIPNSDEPKEGGVVHKLQEVQLLVYRETSRVGRTQP